MPASKAVPLGYEATPEVVQARLKTLMERPGVALLRAAKEKRVMVLYHQYYNSPYSFVAVQAIAKELHPDLLQGRRSAGDMAGAAREVPAGGAVRGVLGRR